MITIGFTGTRKGCTTAQAHRLDQLLDQLQAAELHHGDCIGADSDIHAIATSKGIPTTIHPPDIDTLRAFCKGNKTMPPLPYLKRNQAIVNASDILLATPAESSERDRSGTWATIRYARRIGRPTIIIYPDGSTQHAVMVKPQIFR